MTIDKEYTIGVVVSRAAADDDREAISRLILRPQAGNPPTGTISRFCGYNPLDYSALPCPLKHNPSQDLTVTLDLNDDEAFKEAAISWSSSSTVLPEGNSALGLHDKILVIKARDNAGNAVFPVGTFLLTATMTTPEAQGSASMAITLNSAPACPRPPCFATDSSSLVFPNYTFLGFVNGWKDPDGDSINYEFGHIDNRGGFVARDPAGPSTSYVFKVWKD
eukprot:gene960-1286_t